MNRRNITTRTMTFSKEDQDKLLRETIEEWQAAGPTAIWEATDEITAEWFMARGIDPSTQRVDRTHVEIRPVPWANGADTYGKDFDT